MFSRKDKLSYLGVMVGFMTMVLSYPYSVAAQSGIQQRPADSRLPLPDFVPPKREAGRLLPRIVLPQEKDLPARSADNYIVINKIEITGNTVIATRELLAHTSGYLHKPISHTDLLALRDQLTRIYIDKGYINSGAVLADQPIINGTVRINIIEGRLSQLQYQTSGKLSEAYIRDYIDIPSRGVLNIFDLETQLQYLRQDRHVRQVQGTLLPGQHSGESRLQLNVEEQRRFQGSLQLDNYSSPAVGAQTAHLTLAMSNLSGGGDRLQANLSRSKGLAAYSALYELPLHARDTFISFDIYDSDSDIIEPDFAALNFESSSSSAAVALRQNIFRRLHSKVDLSFKLESRRSQSVFLNGIPFEGRNKVSVLRFSPIWLRQSKQQAFSLRSVFSFGDAQIEGVSAQDDPRIGEFITWFTQLQWAYRFAVSQHQIHIRADMLLSDGPLLNVEQFALGGHASVRGYRENTFVRDNGWAVSAAYVIPWFNNTLQWSFFVDAGRAWNEDNNANLAQQKDLLSIGTGINWKIAKRFGMRLDLAKALKNVPNNAKYNIQDDGVHFSASAYF